jgi:drug/metabolite transporter (DMT)-like permease
MGSLFALMTGLCWATYNLFLRRGMEHIKNNIGYMITLFVGMVANILFFLVLPLPGRGSVMKSPLALLWFTLAGLVSTLLGRWVYFKSIRNMGPSRASAWKNASPIYTLLLGALLLSDHPTLKGIAGTAAVVGGLAVLAREQSKNNKTNGSVSGNWTAAILLAAVSGLPFSVGFLLRKAGLTVWPNAAAGSAIGATAAVLGMLPMSIRNGELAGMTKAPWKGVSAFLVAGCFSGLAQLFTFLSLRVTAAATAQVIAAMEPIFTIFLSALLLRKQEKLTPALVAAATVVCAGVALMSL